jgi:hypothetical protein
MFKVDNFTFSTLFGDSGALSVAQAGSVPIERLSGCELN